MDGRDDAADGRGAGPGRRHDGEGVAALRPARPVPARRRRRRKRLPLVRRGSSAAAGHPAADDTGPVPDERQLAAHLFDGVWAVMETEDRTRAQDDRVLRMAHASPFLWDQVGTPANLARGEWLCSRVYAVLGRAEPCLHHARRVRQLCAEPGIADWDLAFAHEALARAHAVAAAREEVERAMAVDIADPEDRALLLADLESIPGLARPM